MGTVVVAPLLILSFKFEKTLLTTFQVCNPPYALRNTVVLSQNIAFPIKRRACALYETAALTLELLTSLLGTQGLYFNDKVASNRQRKKHNAQITGVLKPECA